jgi:DNA polymerase III sliding clamp (beta) subunit (PCNA family)
MQTTSQTLRELARKLSSVASDLWVFAGSSAFSVGENITVRATCPAIGTFAINAEKANQVFGRLDGNVDLTLLNGLGKEEVNETLVSKLQIKNKRSKFTIPLVAAPQIPKIVVPDKDPIKIDVAGLMDMLKFSSSGSEKNASFNYTGSVQLSGSGQKVTSVGTNGRILMLTEVPSPAKFPTLLLPAQVIQTIKGFAGLKFISEDSTNLYFQYDDFVIIARRLAKEFPDWTKLIPETYAIKVTVKADEMRGSLIRLTINNNEVTMSVMGSHGAAETVLPVAPFSDDPFEEPLGIKFILRMDYLSTYFDNVSGDVTIAAQSEGQPLFFECIEKKLLIASQKAT